MSQSREAYNGGRTGTVGGDGGGGFGGCGFREGGGGSGFPH
jgi:hypothetical protein